MEAHAEMGHRILAGSDVELLDLAALMALTHHERIDGTGYPHGLAGEEIPIEGRIAAVADVFDALTSDRVYRPAFQPDEARTLMLGGRGHAVRRRAARPLLRRVRRGARDPAGDSRRPPDRARPATQLDQALGGQQARAPRAPWRRARAGENGLPRKALSGRVDDLLGLVRVARGEEHAQRRALVGGEPAPASGRSCRA